MNSQNALNTDNIGRLLFKLTIPAFIGMAVVTLYNIVNTIFIGHYVGSLGIAGLSIVFPIQMLCMGMGMMTGMGGASLISRLIGAGDKNKAELALGNALSCTILLSLIIMVAGFADMDFWLRLLGASPEILPYARDYLQIILLGIFLQTLAVSINSFLIAEGNARITMTGQLIGAISNILLDATFIIGLGMGVKGAAIGTVIAQLLSVAYFLNFYFRGKSLVKIHFKKMLFKWGILKLIFAIGISGLAMTLAGSISSVFINRIMVSLGGDIAISTYGILNRIIMFSMLPAISIGQGAQPILGFNFGNNRYDKVIKTFKIAVISSTCLCFLAFLLVYLVPGILVRIFTSESDLITSSVHASRYIFITISITGFIQTSSLVFQALGKASQAFFTAIAKPLAFLLPLVAILSRLMGIDGVWLAYPLTDVLAFLLGLFFVVPLIKTLRKGGVTKEETIPIKI